MFVLQPLSNCGRYLRKGVCTPSLIIPIPFGHYSLIIPLWRCFTLEIGQAWSVELTLKTHLTYQTVNVLCCAMIRRKRHVRRRRESTRLW